MLDIMYVFECVFECVCWSACVGVYSNYTDATSILRTLEEWECG
jgi:hypothetical protein